MPRPRSLVLAAALAALAASPAPAFASVVAPAASDGALALDAAGAPRVAFLAGGVLFAAAERADGAWSSRRLAPVADAGAFVAGFAVAPRGAPVVLVQHPASLELVEATHARRIASPRGRSLGRAGLALDRAGRPVVAYATRTRSGSTALLLVREDARGRLRTRAVTGRGFPSSTVAPAAAPVLLPGGAIRVVETWAGDGARAIEWRPYGDGFGQLLFATTTFGVPAGPVVAAAAPGVVYSAFAVAYGEGRVDVVLAAHGAHVTSAVVAAGVPVALAPIAGGAEAGADVAYAPGIGAGVVAAPGSMPVGLDGLLLGYAAARDGTRHLLLLREGALEELRSPGPLPHRVELDASLSGRVGGASAGFVTLYRVRPDGADALATAPLAGDGSFVFEAPPPAPAEVVRAVYVDPATGIRYAATRVA